VTAKESLPRIAPTAATATPLNTAIFPIKLVSVAMIKATRKISAPHAVEQDCWKYPPNKLDSYKGSAHFFHLVSLHEDSSPVAWTGDIFFAA
jgi:hypothetical protein